VKLSDRDKIGAFSVGCIDKIACQGTNLCMDGTHCNATI